MAAGALTLAPPQPQAVIAGPLGLERRWEYALLAPGETLAAYFDRAGIDVAGPVVVRLSGVRIPREMWRYTRPHSGQLIEVAAVLHGGGGSSKVLRTVALIVVAVAAAYTGGAAAAWAASSGFSAAGASAFGSFASVAVSVAGSLLVNAAFPLTNSLSNTRSDSSSSSPTYSLSSTTNSARSYEPLPVVLGTHRFVPDLAATQYTEFDGDDQYLYAIFHFGPTMYGLNVTDILIGDTPLADYSDVTTQQSDLTTGALTLASGNVDTVAGGTLTYEAGWIERTSSADTVTLAIDIEGSLFYSGDNGIESLTAVFEFEYRAVGATSWLPFFVTDSTAAETMFGKLGSNNYMYEVYTTQPEQFVEGASAGTYDYYVGGDSGGYFESIPLTWHEYDQTEATANSWYFPAISVPTASGNTLTLVNATTKSIRKTYRRDVASGQYEVRGRRITADETDERAASTIYWSVLRSYQTDTADYAGQTRLAVRIRATGQLSGTLNSVSATVSRPLAVETSPGVFAVQVTSNPAWLFYNVLRGYRIDGRLIVGAGLRDAQIDIASIRAWAEFCDANSLTFNAVIDTSTTVGDVLTYICAAGRGSYTFVGGKLGAVWDAPDLPVSAVVGMSNILAGSFSVEYTTRREYEEIVAVFLNAENDYEQEEVRVLLPGVTSPSKIQRVELLGCTSQSQAARFANLTAAALIYRAKAISWRMDIEGTLIRRGDVVALSHDMTQWGYSGRVVSVDGTGAAGSTVFTLDRRIPANVDAPSDTWLGVRVPGEGKYRVLKVTVSGTGDEDDTDTVTLAEAWPSGLALPGENRPALDYVWIYDFRSTPGYRVKVVETIPRTGSNGGIEIEFSGVPDVPEYYDAEGGTFTSVAPTTLLDNTARLYSIALTAEKVINAGVASIEATATWAPNGRTASVILTAQRTRNGTSETVSLGTVAGTVRRHTWAVAENDTWTVTAQPLNSLGVPGESIVSAALTIDTTPPALPESFSVSELDDGTRVYAWAWGAGGPPDDLRGVRIRYSTNTSATWDDMIALDGDTGAVPASPLESVFPGQVGTYRFGLKSQDRSGNLSTDTLYTTATLVYTRVTADGNIYGYKSLFQTSYTGASTVIAADNGRAHYKTDATTVTVPASLPAEMLTTIINAHASAWMRIEFPGQTAVVQGRSTSASDDAWELAPMNSLSLAKLKAGATWLISGLVRRPTT